MALTSKVPPSIVKSEFGLTENLKSVAGFFAMVNASLTKATGDGRRNKRKQALWAFGVNESSYVRQVKNGGDGDEG